MEDNVEVPFAVPERIGRSERQAERLFSRHLGTSPKRHHVSLRLERARRLFQQSGLSVTEVTLACGFDSPAHLGKRHRQHFGISACRTRSVVN